MSIPKKKNFDLVSVKNLNDVKISKRVKEMLSVKTVVLR